MSIIIRFAIAKPATGIVINELKSEKRDFLFNVRSRTSKSTINKKGDKKIVVPKGLKLVVKRSRLK